MIDEINRTRSDHIITIEDPIEFLHRHKRCIVNQREIGTDATSFANALRAALRQDPDVILLGEMRDLETISTALTAAETGHLVFGTLHTQSASGTIDRIIDVFPGDQQDQIRAQIAGSLQGVVTQALLPTADGQGRVAALEILIPDDAIRNLIRQAKVEQIYSYMQTGSRSGMQTMEQSLGELVIKRVDHPRGCDRALEPPRRADRPDRARRLDAQRRAPEASCGSQESEMADQTSIWKKEIRLGRRPRLEEAVVEAMQFAGDGAPSSRRRSSHCGRKSSTSWAHARTLGRARRARRDQGSASPSWSLPAVT